MQDPMIVDNQNNVNVFQGQGVRIGWNLYKFVI